MARKPCKLETNNSKVFDFLMKNFKPYNQPDRRLTVEGVCTEILEDRYIGCRGWSTESDPNGAWQDETLPVPVEACSFVLQSQRRSPDAFITEALLCRGIFRFKKPERHSQLDRLVKFHCELKFSLCSCEDIQHLTIHFRGKEIHSLDILFKKDGHIALRKRED